MIAQHATVAPQSGRAVPCAFRAVHVVNNTYQDARHQSYHGLVCSLNSIKGKVCLKIYYQSAITGVGKKVQSNLKAAVHAAVALENTLATLRGKDGIPAHETIADLAHQQSSP